MLGGLIKTIGAKSAVIRNTSTRELLRGVSLGTVSQILGGAVISHQLTAGSAEERRQAAVSGALTGWLISGYRGPMQVVAGVALGLAPNFGELGIGLITSYRNSRQQRTSLYTPFSHTSIPMDIAYSTMQYARTRVTGANQHLGSEAALYASRYLQR